MGMHRLSSFPFPIQDRRTGFARCHQVRSQRHYRKCSLISTADCPDRFERMRSGGISVGYGLSSTRCRCGTRPAAPSPPRRARGRRGHTVYLASGQPVPHSSILRIVKERSGPAPRLPGTQKRWSGRRRFSELPAGAATASFYIILSRKDSDPQIISPSTGIPEPSFDLTDWGGFDALEFVLAHRSSLFLASYTPGGRPRAQGKATPALPAPTGWHPPPRRGRPAVSGKTEDRKER